MSEKVSLIIPCYNGEEYLDTCFSCILSQTYSNVEIIIVNDGSVDRSEEIIMKYKPLIEKKGYYFKYYFQENQGAAAATNYALKYVEGEYIMLYDVDDIIMPEAIETKSEFLKKNPDYGMVRNNGYYVKSSNIESNAYLFVRNRKEKENEWIFEDLLYGRTNNWAATFMIRSSMLFRILENRNIYVSQYGQNLQLMLPISYHYKTGFIDKPLIRYVDFGKSHSRTKSSERQLELISGFEKNRIEIIKSMNLSDNEKMKYMEDIMIFYNRIRLNYARQISKKKLLEEQYNILKSKGKLTIKDKINMLCGKHRFVNKVYNVMKFSKGAVRAMFFRCEGVILRR